MIGRLIRFVFQCILIFLIVSVGLVLLYKWVPVPVTATMLMDPNGVTKDWTSLDRIDRNMVAAAIAAEDGKFCSHNGFDAQAIEKAIQRNAKGGRIRGGSTISQQTAKNVFLWQGRSWLRKAIEAGLTPLVELVWSKQRILEVYLNVAEFDEGVFGVQAAAQHYFGVDARDLSALQAARLAAVLPDPKGRSASKPSSFVRRRTGAIMSGAETILADGRADCFETRD